jgi:hypothetical protein
MENQRRFDLLLAAMPEKILDFGGELKALLLETHTLSNQEKMDVLFQIQAVGWPKAITDVAHHDGLLSIKFQYMFLQHLLPAILRTLLGEQEPGDIRSLAARADKLWATHTQQSHNAP